MKIKILAFVVSLVISLSVTLSAQRVFMFGDSHVCGKKYPEQTSKVLKDTFPAIEFSFWGKNGICFHSVNKNPQYLDSLFSFNPDIAIIHLGTNGAYENNFSGKAFREEMESFISLFRERMPECKIVFITPFTNKKRRYRKKGNWFVNKNNRKAADEIVEFVKTHHDTFVIDNNEEVGNLFINSKTLIRPDNVHLTEKGYRLLGTQVGESIVAINDLWTTPEL